MVAWWAAGNNAPASPLHRMLLGREPRREPLSDDVRSRRPTRDVRHLVAGLGPRRRARAVVRAETAPTAAARTPPDDRELAVRDFHRVVDTSWRRTSYTALLGAAR